MAMNNNSYENQEIIQLSEREQCRQKLPVFFGDYSNFMHSARECLLNARDEVSNNFDSGVIRVKLYDDNETIEVADTGRGINLWGETNGSPNYYLLLEKLWAGGNHDNLKLGIATTGTNSVGLTCTNYCAEFFEITSYKNYKYRKITYKDGGILQNIEDGENETIEHGTVVKFKQDPKIYTKIRFDKKEVEEMCLKISSTSPSIVYVFEHKDNIKEFNFENQIQYMSMNTKNTLCDFIQFANKRYEEEVKKDGDILTEIDTIQTCISLSTAPLIETFLNGTWLMEGGSIQDGIGEGIRKFFNKGQKKNKITLQDVLMSFNIHCLFSSTNPSFSGQTKFSSASPTYKKIAQQYILENLEILEKENPKVIDQMKKHLEAINKLNTRATENRSKINKELEERSNTFITRPRKLVPCRSKNPKEISISLLEGDSALNSVKLGRDSEYMMVYPLKGKPINAMKSTINKILENQEIIDIYKILGCGMEYNGKPIKGIKPFNIDDLLVDEILIITDQDEDGMHLETLVIGDFYTLSPELIKQGKVKSLLTPLYIITTKEKEYWAYSELERCDIINKLNASGEKYKEKRYKGIGGLSVETMAKCLDKKTRKVVTVTMEQGEKSAEMLKLFLEEDVEPRKDYISAHAKEYSTKDIYI